VLNIPAAKSSIDCFRGEVASLPGPKGTFRPSASGSGITFFCGLPTESDARRR